LELGLVVAQLLAGFSPSSRYGHNLIATGLGQGFRTREKI